MFTDITVLTNDEYAFEDEKFKVLRFEKYTETWFDFVMLNRLNKSGKQSHNFDIVEDPIANDDVTQRIFLYQRGQLSKGRC